MVKKRDFRDQEGDRNRSKLRKIEDLARWSSFNKRYVESYFRRVVREVLDEKLVPYLNVVSSRMMGHHQAGPSGVESGLQLRFKGQLPKTLYTGNKIEVLSVILYDTRSNSIVTTGPLSSAKVEIVALNSEFMPDEDWAREEFEGFVVREREGRRPLVAGETTVALVEGVGFVGNVMITDNSSWMRSGKFRLAARVVSSVERVREAVTEPFKVKDQRGELYKKNHPPGLNDEVWRLEKIAKDGPYHKRLTAHGIKNVQDLLRLNSRDPNSLRKILGKIPEKTWKGVIEHATQCVVDDNKFYAYHKSEHGVSVLFNSVFRVVQACFGTQYLSPEQLNPSQMVLLESMIKQAFRSIDELVPVDGAPMAGPEWPIPPQINDSASNYPSDIQILPQGNQQICAVPATIYPAVEPNINSQPSVPSPLPSQPNSNSQFVFPPFHRNSFSLEDYFPQTGNFELGSSSNSFQLPSFYFAENFGQLEDAVIPGFMSRDRTSQWGKIRAAIKCWLSVKEVAIKKMSRPMYLRC